MQINQVTPVIFHSMEQRIHNSLYFGVQDQLFSNSSKLNNFCFSTGTSEVHCFLGMQDQQGLYLQHENTCCFNAKKIFLMQVYSNQSTILHSLPNSEQSIANSKSHQTKAYYSSPKADQILGKFPLCLSIAHKRAPILE